MEAIVTPRGQHSAEIDDPHGVGIIVEITTISEFAFGQPPGVQPDELVKQYAGQQYIGDSFYAADEQNHAEIGMLLHRQ